MIDRDPTRDLTEQRNREEKADEAVKFWEMGAGYKPPRNDIAGSVSYWRRLTGLLGEKLGDGHPCTQEAGRLVQTLEASNPIRHDVIQNFVGMMNSAESDIISLEPAEDIAA